MAGNDTRGGANWQSKFGQPWKQSDNRGFYLGPSGNNVWSNEIGWRDSINRENRILTRSVLLQEEALAGANVETGSVRSEGSAAYGSVATSSSRESLYRHFDKLTKEEQIAVLKDALGKKERLEKLEGMSEKFDHKSLKGLNPQAKAEALIKALGNERTNRVTKEKIYLQLLDEERTARIQAETKMKELETRLTKLESPRRF